MVRVWDTGTAPAFNALVGPGVGFFNDFDSLEVGSDDGATSHDTSPKLTLVEQQSHFSLWAAIKAPLILGNDPRQMTRDTLSILSNAEVIAVNQDVLVAPVKLLSRSRASGSMKGEAKAVMRPCSDSDTAQQWIVKGTQLESSAAPGQCLALWNCLTRWPWWLATAPCSAISSGTNSTAMCSPSDQQSFHIDRSGTGRIAWAPGDPKLAAPCWGSPGVGCCLSVEGANPELDTCGWAPVLTEDGSETLHHHTSHEYHHRSQEHHPDRSQEHYHRPHATTGDHHRIQEHSPA